MDELLENLKKKDDDMEVIEQTLFTTKIQTTLDIGTPIEEPEPQIPIEYSVHTKNIRYLFIILATLWICLTMFSIVPGALLQMFKLPLVALTLFICATMTSCVLLGALYLVKGHKDMVYACFACLCVCLFTIIFSSFAYFDSIAPFQACITLFDESIAVLVYCLSGEKLVNGWWVGFFMMIVGVVNWIIGFVAFVKEHDWIFSGILFFTCVVFFPFYSGYFIHSSERRFAVGEFNHLIVAFFTDFYIIPLKWIHAWYVKKFQQT